MVAGSRPWRDGLRSVRRLSSRMEVTVKTGNAVVLVIQVYSETGGNDIHRTAR